MSYALTASSEMTTVVGHVVESEPVLGHVVQSQPHGSFNNRKYMASPGKIEEFRNLKDEAERCFFCPCKSSFCKSFLALARRLAFTPPWTLHVGFLSFLAVPIGCLCELSPCDPCAKTKVPVPSESLQENPVATITPDGVIVDTFFELNDEADTQSTLIPWVNILSVSVRKPRKHLRSCGTCEYKNDQSKPFEGIAFTCDVDTGLIFPCFSVVCKEKGIEDYSEVIFYSSKSGYLSSSQLINGDPALVKKCETLNSQGKEFLVGTDITKVNVMALLQVDQFVADIQSAGANYRNGAPVPVHENKVHLVHNPEAKTTSSGYTGGDGGDSGAGKYTISFYIFSNLSNCIIVVTDIISNIRWRRMRWWRM